MEPVDAALFALGVLALGAVAADVVGALLGGDGRGGWVTDRLGRLLWRLGARRRGSGHHRVAVAIGQTIILSTLLTWILGAWLGWTLVFWSSGGGIVESSTGIPAGLTSTIYYTGYTMFTLGLGDFRPDGGAWQMATTLATLSGFAVMTVAITYVVPLIQAASASRTVAASIASHGIDVAALRTVLDDPEAAGTVNDLTDAIVAITETSAAFPAVHYLHTSAEHRSAPAMIALLGRAALEAAPSTRVDRLTSAVRGYLRFHPTDRGDSTASLPDRLADVRRDDGRDDRCDVQHDDRRGAR